MRENPGNVIDKENFAEKLPDTYLKSNHLKLSTPSSHQEYTQ